MVKEALKEIVKHTVPGSYIVANDRVCCCSYESLQNLRQYKIISIEQLQKFDPPGKSKLLNNLGNYSSLYNNVAITCFCIYFSTCINNFCVNYPFSLIFKKQFGKAPLKSVRKFKKLRTLQANISLLDTYGDKNLEHQFPRLFKIC